MNNQMASFMRPRVLARICLVLLVACPLFLPERYAEVTVGLAEPTVAFGQFPDESGDVWMEQAPSAWQRFRQAVFSSKWTFFVLFAGALLAFNAGNKRLAIVMATIAFLLSVVRTPLLLFAGIVFVSGFAILKGLRSPREQARKGRRRAAPVAASRYVRELEEEIDTLRSEVDELKHAREAEDSDP